MEERLASVVGVRPSPEWLEACIDHLNSNGSGNGNGHGHGHGNRGSASSGVNQEDEVLYQIINTDLRNVVRRVPSSGTTSNNNSPGAQLRHAISQSLPQVNTNTNNNTNANNSNINSCKATLPSSFRILLQIEELLDVSQNVEDRIAHGPSSSSAPKPSGNQSKRCLKMCVSDGYYPNGQSTSTSISASINNNADVQVRVEHIVAMETSPIPSLSVNSKPGIKIIICGPINIHCGILHLHPGNTTVCGGCIPSLIPIQQKALELAGKLAGVGMDSTFRALVWNPEKECGIEEEDDEGEGESGDVVAVPRPIVPTTTTRAIHNIHNNNIGRGSGSGNSSTNNLTGRQRTNMAQHHQLNSNADTIMDMEDTHMNIAMPREGNNPASSNSGVRNPFTIANGSANSNTIATSSNNNKNNNNNNNNNPYLQRQRSSTSSNSASMPPPSRNLNRKPSTNTTTSSISRPHNPYASSSSSKISSSNNNNTTPMNPYQTATMPISEQSSVSSSTSTSSNTGSRNNAYNKSSTIAASHNPYTSTRKLNTGTSSSTGSTAYRNQQRQPLHVSTDYQNNKQNKSFNSDKAGVGVEEVVDLTSPDSIAGAESGTSSFATTPHANGNKNSSTSAPTRTPATSRKMTKSNLNATTASTFKRKEDQPAPSSSVNRPLSITASTPFRSSANIKINNGNLSPTALSEPMSFQELRTLLGKLIDSDKNDEQRAEEYSLYENKTFIVPCKLHSKQNMNNMAFNMEKKSKKKKRVDKSDKYDYIMTCQMTGSSTNQISNQNQTDEKITCKLTNDILQEYLPLKAAEMKKLFKSDKAKANKLANEGGVALFRELKTLAVCHLKLLHSKDVFIEKKICDLEGKEPILTLDVREVP